MRERSRRHDRRYIDVASDALLRRTEKSDVAEPMSTIAGMGSAMGAITRVAIGLLVGLILTAGAVSPVQARHANHRHVHHTKAAPAQFVDASSVNLGPMRYYGGPKSPMWRGPVMARVEPAVQAPSHLGAMRYYGGPKSPMWRGPAEN
jgi:hypothetical protein